MYMAIFGMFSFVWFGWAQENPRRSWRKYLGIASGVALAVSLIGIYLSATNWHEGSALSAEGAYTSYLIFVFIEFALAGIGGVLFIKFKRNAYVAPWILFIVGIHFFWLQGIFEDPSLLILAILLVGIAFASFRFARKLNVATSAITGIGAGTVLFCFAVLGWIRFLIA